MTSTCPQLVPSCAHLNLVDATFSTLSQCTLQGYNGTATVCLCELNQQTQPDGRRLSEIDDVVDYTGVANVAAISVYVGESFTSTFGASSDFTTAADLAQVLIVVYLFCTLWGLGLLLFGVCVARNDKRLYGLLAKKFTGDKTAEIAPAPASGTMGAGAEPRERLLSYIQEVIPQVYADGKRSSERVLEELCAHHRYMTLFTLGDGQIPFNNKMIILLKVLTVDTMQMFLLAVLYDLQCRDDDCSCIGLATESRCLERKSILDSTQSFCQWTYDQRQSGFVCSYKVPHNSAWTFIYIFVIVSIVTSVFNVPIDYLFGVCVAPSEEELSLHDGSNSVFGLVTTTAAAVTLNARRLSNAARTIVQPYVTRVSSLLQKTKSGKVRKDNIVDSEMSEDLRQRYNSAVQILPRLSIRADVRKKARSDAALHVRSVALNRHSSIVINGASQSKGKAEGKRSEEVRRGESTAVVEASDVEAPSLTAADFSLHGDILAQRLLLGDDDQAAEYDAQWGIERSEPHHTVYTLSTSAWTTISATIAESDEIAEETNKQMPQFTKQHAGLTVLHLFIQDLLGRNTPAAKIFSSKFEENFVRTRAVGKWGKSMALGSILLCNGFFIYYSLLKAFVKGRAWQRAYVVACIVQMLVEIMLNETLECLWLNYWVPSLVRRDVQNAVNLIKFTTEELTCDDLSAQSMSRVFLDAPTHLFASTKVAKKNEALLESVLVLSYHSYLPGELCKLWPHYQEAQRQRDRENERRVQVEANLGATLQFWIIRYLVAALATVVALIQWSGTLGFSYQRIVIRIFQPMLFSGLTMLCYFSTSSPGGFAMFSMGVLSIVGVVWWMRRSEDQQTTKLRLQVAPEATLDAELEEELAALTAAATTKKAASEKSSSSSASSQYPSELSNFSGDLLNTAVAPSLHSEPEQQHSPAGNYDQQFSDGRVSLSSFDLAEAELGEQEAVRGQRDDRPAPVPSPAPTVADDFATTARSAELVVISGPTHDFATLPALIISLEPSKKELSSDDDLSLSSASNSHDSDDEAENSLSDGDQ